MLLTSIDPGALRGDLAERLLPRVKLDRYPRMADFARVLAAVDKVLGTNALDAYRGQGARLAEDVIESDPVAAAVYKPAQTDRDGPARPATC